jgi:outer membrane protein OmpA-like peptidoglycan-associated protein
MKYLCSAIGCFLLYSSGTELPVVLKDEFNNHTCGWWTGSGENFSMVIENGKYIIDTQMKNAGRYSTVAPAFDLGKDFLIEASFVQKSGSINNGFGLLWGDNGNGQRCEFLIASNGNFKIKNAEGSEPLNKWIPFPVNSLGKENILRVEAISHKWHYYINGEEVAVTEAFPLYGNRMGVINYTDMVLEMDNFIFRQDLGIHLPPNLTFGFVKESLGPMVNSEYDEVGPHISTDGRTIWFGVKNSPDNRGGVEDGEDTWFTTSEDGKTWSARMNPGNDINTTETDNLASLSADNNTLLYSRADGFVIRTRTANGWSLPERLPISFFNEAGNTEAHWSADGKAILFSARLKQNIHYNIPGKEKDLYVSLKKKGEEWSYPVNIGRQINTSGDEISPFLAADGRTLYFGSNGRPGYGSYDIFMSKRLGEGWTQWTEPYNLGPEINGPGFDAYFTLAASANYAYLVSTMAANSKGDLARIPLPEAVKPKPIALITGKTLHAVTKNPVASELTFADKNSKAVITTIKSDPVTGAYAQVLDQGSYQMQVEAPGFIPVNENIALARVEKYTELTKTIFLLPIEENETILLEHVYFQQGRAILKTESYPELDRLVELMQKNPTMKIELAGHTDNVGSNEVLLQLSQDRVEEVKKYLVSKGIRKDRIAGKGYGATRPLLPNNSNENRERNRRVEFRIVKR